MKPMTGFPINLGVRSPCALRSRNRPMVRIIGRAAHARSGVDVGSCEDSANTAVAARGDGGDGRVEGDAKGDCGTQKAGRGAARLADQIGRAISPKPRPVMTP